MKNGKLYFAASLVALATLAACESHDPAAVVKQRAEERWKLLVEGHAVKAYDYLSPGYRSTHSLEQYVAFISTTKLVWKEATVQKVECDTDTCTAHLLVKSTIPGHLINIPQDVTTESPLVEHWLPSDGQWFIVPEANISTTAVMAPQTPSATPDRPAAQTASPSAQGQPSATQNAAQPGH